MSRVLDLALGRIMKMGMMFFFFFWVYLIVRFGKYYMYAIRWKQISLVLRRR